MEQPCGRISAQRQRFHWRNLVTKDHGSISQYISPTTFAVRFYGAYP